MSKPSLGSLRASKTRSHWRIIRTYYENGIRKEATVAKTAWAALGFTDSMSLDQARAHASQLNAQSQIKREETRSIAAIAHRVERDRLSHSAFIPDDLNQQFLTWLEQNTSGTEAYIDKQKIIWSTAKKCIITLQLTPEHFSANKKAIFRHLSANNRRYSLDYVRKITSLMNQYGRFCARLTGKYFEPIPPPRGSEREMLADSYAESNRYRGASDSLTPEALEALKGKLSIEHYNWLFVTLWLGLRPIECTMVMKDRTQLHWQLIPGTTDVIKVYQSKLKSLPKAKRWKLIPLKYPEQQQALEICLTGNAKAPLVKTLQAHTNNERITLYGGRHGFLDVMLEHGEPLDAIAAWMGHQNIARTWQYRDRQTKVNLGLRLVNDK